MKSVLISLEGRSIEDAALASLRAVLDRVPSGKRALSVWLSGALARPFMFGPVKGLRGWVEARLAAESYAQQVFGAKGPYQVVLEGDPSARGVLASAVAAPTIDSIYRAASTLSVRIKSIRPAWAGAFDSRHSQISGSTVFACRDADSFTALSFVGGQCESALTHAPPPETNEREMVLRRLHVASAALKQSTVVATISVSGQGKVVVDWAVKEPVSL
jgi:hypothetical protein